MDPYYYNFSLLLYTSLISVSGGRSQIETEKPHLIVPEVEAIATDVLVAVEKEGFTVLFM